MSEKNHLTCRRAAGAALALLYIAALFWLMRKGGGSGIFVRRAEVVTLIFAVPAIGLAVGFRRLFDFCFRYRVALAACLLLWYVANDFNGSSISCWSIHVTQETPESDYAFPLFGHPLEVRADEWEVNVPRQMTGQYTHFAKENSIVMGTETDNIAASGLYLDYSALAKPSYWGFYLLGYAHGLSFQWGYMIIIGYLISFELFFLLTGRPVLGVLGGAIFWFSTFNVGWSYTIPILAIAAIPVFFYYTLRAADWKRRLGFGLLLAISGADFICNMYPAWQVPAGWVIVAILLYFLVTYREWKNYGKKDWLAIAIAFVFMVSVVVRYYMADMGYIQSISQTVYPGKRLSTGWNSIGLLLGDQAMFLSGLTQTVVNGNNSESGAFALAFPLGYLLLPAGIYFSGIFRKEKENSEEAISLRNRGRLLIFLAFPLVLYTFYVTTGIPLFLAKITLLDHSLAPRLTGILGALLVICVMVSASIILDAGGLRFPLALLFTVAAVLPSFLRGLGLLDGKKMKYALLAVALLSALTVFFLVFRRRERTTKFRQAFFVFAAACFSISSIYIHPLMVGTSAITDKEGAKAIQRVVEKDPDALWMANDRVIAQFAIANGAPTLNSTSYIPNRDLWAILDQDGKYENIWNRYAHIELDFLNEGSDRHKLYVQKWQEDVLVLHLTKQDFDKLGVKYIVMNVPIPAGEWAEGFDLVDSGGNLTIWINKDFE